MPAAMISWL